MRKRKKNKTVIANITVKGFKTFKDECSINIKPLTILSGSNSSGKSSIFQPLLLMKQTLNEVYDPGALQLNGANVKFSKSDELLTKGSEKREFTVGLRNDTGLEIKLTYGKEDEKRAGFEIKNMLVRRNHENVELELSEEMNEEVMDILFEQMPEFLKTALHEGNNEIVYQRKLIRKRCFYEFSLFSEELGASLFSRSFVGVMGHQISEMLHLPGLRGNPERNYPLTARDVENINFAGTFEKYVASIIANWKETKNDIKLSKLKKQLKALGLASNIDTEYINDTELALYVSRYNNSQDDDLVNIADVGLGVSQTLPILVALLVAKENQIVYMEQPEIHLHPKAQYKMANIIADSIKRGIIVVIETHSSIFLRGIQTLVAKGSIKPADVALHWFLRKKKNGDSYVKSADLDEHGAFGDWPEDFDEIGLTAESNYLDAVEKRLFND